MALKYEDVRVKQPKFTSVEAYLEWIMEHQKSLTRATSSQDLTRRKLLKTLIGSLMMYCYDQCPEFQAHIDMWEECSIKQALEQVLRKVSEEEYTLRLFLKLQGPHRVIEMYKPDHLKTDIVCTETMLRLNQSMTKEDRQQLRTAMSPCFIKGDQLSAKKILLWLFPVIQKYFTLLDGKEVLNHTVHTVMSDTKEAKVLLICIPKIPKPSPTEENGKNSATQTAAQTATQTGPETSATEGCEHNEEQIEKEGTSLANGITETIEDMGDKREMTGKGGENLTSREESNTGQVYRPREDIRTPNGSMSSVLGRNPQIYTNQEHSGPNDRMSRPIQTTPNHDPYNPNGRMSTPIQTPPNQEQSDQNGRMSTPIQTPPNQQQSNQNGRMSTPIQTPPNQEQSDQNGRMSTPIQTPPNQEQYDQNGRMSRPIQAPPNQEESDQNGRMSRSSQTLLNYENSDPNSSMSIPIQTPLNENSVANGSRSSVLDGNSQTLLTHGSMSTPPKQDSSEVLVRSGREDYVDNLAYDTAVSGDVYETEQEYEEWEEEDYNNNMEDDISGFKVTADGILCTTDLNEDIYATRYNGGFEDDNEIINNASKDQQDKMYGDTEPPQHCTGHEHSKDDINQPKQVHFNEIEEKEHVKSKKKKIPKKRPRRRPSNSLRICLNLELATHVSSWPPRFQLHHPLPMVVPYAKYGQQLLRDVTQVMEERNLNIVVHTAIGKSLADPQDDKRPMTFRERRQAKGPYIRTWKTDLSNIENYMLKQCLSYDETLNTCCTGAMKLYSIISSKGKKVLPQLDEQIRNTLLLHVIKKRTGNIWTEKQWFLALVDQLLKAMKTGFCPSFTRTNINVWPHGKITGIPLARVEAFRENLANTNGVQMLKYAVGIYGLKQSQIITKTLREFY